MALDIEIFKKVVAPEYASMNNDELAPFVSEAELEIAVSKWKKFAPRAVALITAHLIKLSELSKEGLALSPNRQLKKTKVGDLEKEYMPTAKSVKESDAYGLTSYGIQYKTLRKRILKTPLFVGP